jgi:nicotinamidase-related amidase
MKKDSALVVVDMLYDFIDGSMACQNADNAVAASLQWIDRETADAADLDESGIHSTLPILFVCDHHPADHCSFAAQGGPWPPHCVQGTRGAEIHDALRPHAMEEFTFYKGEDRNLEQYSGFEGVNAAGQTLGEVLSLMDIRTVYVCGIATEYCVRNTAEDLLKAGFRVTVLKDCLAWVERQGHEEALEAMKAERIRLA